MKYFRIFGRKCYLKRDDDIGKFDARSDEGMFLGYSLKRKAHRCFNYNTNTIVECTNVRVDEKFGVQEIMLEYNFDEEVDHGTNHGFNEIFVETNNNL